MKRFLLLIPVLFMIGCGNGEQKQKQVVDTNKTTSIKLEKLNMYNTKIVCNEFGVAYYESFIHGGSNSLTPVLKPGTNAYSEVSVVTCKELEERK